MKKQEFRNFVKEVVKNVLRENTEPYDAETDQFGNAPRDRTEPSEHQYDEHEEMKKINDILVVCEHANKRLNDPSYFPLAISQIQKICIELLKMHGAK